MAAKSKGLTHSTHLRMTSPERMLVGEIQEVYGSAGIPMSLNDTIRHLIRRGGIVLAYTMPDAWDAVREHCEGCAVCTEDPLALRCPEGLYLHRSFRRVLRAHGGGDPGDRL